jgi:CarD family transcriptional regulator
VGRIVSKRRRRPLAGERDYLEIDIIDKSLTIMLPVESATTVGLRPVIGAPDVRRIVAVLEDEPISVPGRWATRDRHYRDRLRGGDVLALASVVRDLAVRATETELASTEQTLYEHSRRRLASELGCALDLDPEQAADYIDAHIAHRE